jgi:hypothetical protein
MTLVYSRIANSARSFTKERLRGRTIAHIRSTLSADMQAMMAAAGR